MSHSVGASPAPTTRPPNVEDLQQVAVTGATELKVKAVFLRKQPGQEHVSQEGGPRKMRAGRPDGPRTRAAHRGPRTGTPAPVSAATEPREGDVMGEGAVWASPSRRPGRTGRGRGCRAASAGMKADGGTARLRLACGDGGANTSHGPGRPRGDPSAMKTQVVSSLKGCDRTVRRGNGLKHG